jgi:hypothetical protein
MGMEVPLYFEKISVEGQPSFRSVPMVEWTGRSAEQRKQDKELMGHMADAYDMIGDAYEQEVGGPAAAIIRSMTNDVAQFSRAAATAPDVPDGRAEAAASVRGAAGFARRAKLVGREVVDGREAFHLRAEGLSDIQLAQDSSEATFVLATVDFWIDATEYVPLRLLMHGNMEAEGRASPLTIELLERDYARVGSLYEARRRVMRMTGLMEAATTDPKQKKEMEKARRQMEKARADMAKMEEQLAKMPAAQRKLVEGRIKQGMAQMEQMLGGVFETELELSVIGINQGPPLDRKPKLGR